MFRRTSIFAALALAATAASLSPCRADLIKQSATYSRTVLMTSTSDHITGATGLTLTVTASKAGAAYASISPTVTELGNGIYSVALASSNTGTIGALDMHVTASGADPSDTHDQIVGFDPTSDLGAAALATNATAVAALPASVWGYTTRTTTSGGGGADPWATALPGSYSAGTAGALLGALAPSSIWAYSARTLTGNVNLNLGQTLDLTQIGAVDTVGAALNGAHAGITKAVVNGTPGTAGSTLVIYAGNGTTILKTYDLSTAGSKL